MGEYLPMAFGVLTFLVGLGILGLYFATGRKNSLFLHFGGMSLLWLLLTFHFWLPDFGIVSWNMQDSSFYILTALMMGLIYFFVERALSLKMLWARIVIGVCMLVCLVLAVTATEMDPITGWRLQHYRRPRGCRRAHLGHRPCHRHNPEKRRREDHDDRLRGLHGLHDPRRAHDEPHHHVEHFHGQFRLPGVPSLLRHHDRAPDQPDGLGPGFNPRDGRGKERQTRVRASGRSWNPRTT